MCGIAGALGPRPVSEDRLTAAYDTMAKRGPDARGSHQCRMQNNYLSLLHTRLSIIDLDARAHQPFKRDGMVLVFNGEIYNYRELRKCLAAKGHHFSTSSDTEVVIAAYREWGPGCVDRFEGMWAIALYDSDAQHLWLSRDRFGEKPLLFMHHDGSLFFASEVKTLAALAGGWPQPNIDQIRRYLVNGYKALYKQNRTWFEGVTELPAGSSALVTDPSSVTATPYWRLSYSPRPMSASDALDGARDRLIEAVRLRLRSDVPVAFCLSGGVDSSTLAGIAVRHCAAKVHAFSIVDQDPRYNELDNIRQTIAFLDSDLHVIETSTEGFFDRLDRLVADHDAPVATITYYLHASLSEAIHQAGFKVALSGTAADELFTGYYDHYGFWLAEMSDRPDFSSLVDDWRESYGRHVRNPMLQDPLAFAKNPDQRDHIYLNAERFESLLVEPLGEPFEESHYADNLLRNRMLNEIHHEAVPVILKEDDLNSMRASVENRSPYLDRQLAEFLFTVPSEHLIHDGYAKFLLRAAGEGVVPDPVRLDRRKRGFNASIDSLVDRSQADTCERLLADGPIFDLVRRDAFTDFFHGDMSANSASKFLFSFIAARSFLDQQAENPSL